MSRGRCIIYPIKQNTAINSLFFLFDSNGDPVTGKVDGDFTKRISKNGGAFAALTITVAEQESGWYSLTLSSSHTDTLGILSLRFTASGAKQVNLQYRIHARVLDDLAFPATAGRSLAVDTSGRTDLGQWVGTAPNALIGGRVDANAQVVGDKTGYSLTQTFPANFATQVIDASGRIDLSKVNGTAINNLISGRVDASVGAMAAAVITAAAHAANAIDATAFAQAAADKAWSTATRTLTAFSFSVTASTVTDKTGYSLAGAGLDSVVVETGLNARQALSINSSALGGVLAGAATTTITIAAAGTPATNRITASVDASGNRSAVTLSPPA